MFIKACKRAFLVAAAILLIAFIGAIGGEFMAFHALSDYTDINSLMQERRTEIWEGIARTIFVYPGVVHAQSNPFGAGFFGTFHFTANLANSTKTTGCTMQNDYGQVLLVTYSISTSQVGAHTLTVGNDNDASNTFLTAIAPGAVGAVIPLWRLDHSGTVNAGRVASGNTIYYQMSGSGDTGAVEVFVLFERFRTSSSAQLSDCI